MDKLSENKHAFLLGDFNIDLMKNDIDEHTATFLNTLTIFLSHTFTQQELLMYSKTLIDIIFSNTPNFSQGKSGNLTLSISDHLAQFLIIPLGIYLKKLNCSNVIKET